MKKNIEYKTINEISFFERQQILSILSEYYINHKLLLEYLFNHNTHIYLLNFNKKIIAFYMIGIRDMNNIKFIHLGQCAIKKNKKGNLIIKLLFDKQLKDLKQLYSEKTTIVYATTATEMIFNYCFHIYKNVAPNKLGNYSIDDISKLNKVLQLEKWTSSNTHPFLIKRLSKKSRFKENEFNNSDNFFSKLQINEKQGDRLLIILTP